MNDSESCTDLSGRVAPVVDRNRCAARPPLRWALGGFINSQ